MTFHYREALRIFPSYGTAAYNLATWLHALGPSDSRHDAEDGGSGSGGGGYGPWFDETSGLYRRAVMASPGLFESYHNLASLLLGGAQKLQQVLLFTLCSFVIPLR